MYGLFLVLVLFVAGCAKDKTKETMTAEELSSKAYGYIKKDRHDDAIAYIDELVTRFPDHTDIAKYKMLLAELHFKESNYNAAKELFSHYEQFYPSDKRAEYAKYKAVLSSFYQTLPSDCDQSFTDETIQLGQEYLTNASFKKYRNDINEILKTCTNRLIEKEIYVFNFYLSKKQFDAARNRLKHLRSKFVTADATLEPRILYLEYKLATKEEKSAEADASMQKLLTQFPDSRFTSMAQSLSSKHQAFIF